MSKNGFIIEDDEKYSPGSHSGGSRDIYSGRKSPKKSKRKVVNTILSVVLAISIICTGVCYLVGFYDISDDNGLKGMEDVKTSISEDVTYVLVAGTDEEKLLTDILMVVCYDHGKQQASILQIPRDTFIGTDIPTGKVNAVYGSADEGESKINFLMKRINDYFGLPLDQYVVVSIEAFNKIVDAMGGIDVYVPEYMEAFDADQTCHYIDAGVNHLNGKEAEAFVRFRRTYAKGDLSRVEAQRNFYAAFFKAVLNMSTSQMVSVATDCYNDVTTSMSIGTLLDYAKEVKKMPMENVGIFAVPGQSGMYSPGGETLSYFSINKQQYVSLVNHYMFPYNPEGISADTILIEQLHESEVGEVSFVDTGGSLASYTDANPAKEGTGANEGGGE